jgi:hypothetical protein
MWVHVHFETVMFTFPKHPNGIIHEFIVILSPVIEKKRLTPVFNVNQNGIDVRSFVFECLPCKRESKHIKTPATQPCEVNVGRPIIDVQRTTCKTLTTILCCVPEAIEKI